jgi:hypothetical protein
MHAWFYQHNNSKPLATKKEKRGGALERVANMEEVRECVCARVQSFS